MIQISIEKGGGGGEKKEKGENTFQWNVFV